MKTFKSLRKTVKSLRKTIKLQNNFNYQVTHRMLKPSKSKTSKSPEDYQVDKIVNFEVNATTLK